MRRANTLSSIVRNAKSHALYRYLPKVVDWMVGLSTTSACKEIIAASANRLLIDNTVIGHAVTHETGWIDTGRQMWGGKIPVDTGYSARIPVHSETDNSDATRSARFLPGIASLADQGAVTLFTSPELEEEQLSQPPGRFIGYGYFDYSLFSRVKMVCLPDPDFWMPGHSMVLGLASSRDLRRERLERRTDPLFRELVKVLGPGNSQDAWHIATAENNGCFCFLTMDFRLLGAMTAQRNNRVISSLKTRVMSPEQFGKQFGLLPVSPRLYSYHGASYPVHTEFNWPDSKRRQRRHYRKK